ncbi:phenylalanine--tRNA ligase subunit beta [Candidatus Bathyarchaeota archaeon]|nr:MAG: phenylalanine--tRNA ligase subunit beta [Candidatus Bathyarchaeota archaeon]
MPRDRDGLNEIFAFVKGDVESLDGDAVSIEVKDSNRPDIWSVEGIASALKGYLGVGRIRPITVAGRSNLNVVVDKRVKPIRPFISTAIVKGLQPTDEALKSWINLQEKLDQTYGRKRKRASIGFYQADLIQSPLSYTVANPDIITFAPLGSEEKQSLREIVSTHPKGSEYGEIISQFESWPVLVDATDNVLSLPPVINSNGLGRITTGTRNILVEVTGTNAETVHNTLKIVVSSLAERGGRIYSCLETYPYGSPRRLVSPDLSPTAASLRLSHINKLLGTSIGLREASRFAERAGYRVRRAAGDSIQLEIPCYRTDIMHSVDMMEDIAIAMDINKLKPEWPMIWTVGNLAKETDETEGVAEIMIGLGFQEVLTYALTSPIVASDNTQSSERGLVELLNPRITTHTVLRNWLLPSLFETLSHNTHVDYPQRIFEIGPCIGRGENRIHPIRETRKLAAVTIHANAGFTEIRSSFDALAENKGRSFQIKETEHPSFLSGRCGAIISDGTEVGVIGEVNPRVIKAWGLNLPAAAFEVEMSALSLA